MGNEELVVEKRGRGRPRKPVDPALALEPKERRGRGRPKGSKNKPKPPVRGKRKGDHNKNPYKMSPAALEQRRNNTALLPVDTPEERILNARQIEHIIRVQEIAQNADRHDLLSLKSCFIAYLKLCQEDGFKVGNLAAYASMGFDFATFSKFCHKDDPEIKAFCRFIKSTCAMFRENMVSENQLNPVIGIFWQRNFDGLRNDTEQVQAISERDDEYSGSKGYKDRYRKLIGEET